MAKTPIVRIGLINSVFNNDELPEKWEASSFYVYAMLYCLSMVGNKGKKYMERLEKLTDMQLKPDKVSKVIVFAYHSVLNGGELIPEEAKQINSGTLSKIYSAKNIMLDIFSEINKRHGEVIGLSKRVLSNSSEGKDGFKSKNNKKEGKQAKQAKK